jgi:hypothetical protein
VEKESRRSQSRQPGNLNLLSRHDIYFLLVSGSAGGSNGIVIQVPVRRE